MPLPCPLSISRSPSGVSPGWTMGAAIGLVVSATSHSCEPSAADTLVAPWLSSSTTCGTPLIVTACGEL